MNSIYFDAIEKVASQAWKRHFAELGVDSIKRLESAGVLNRAKELRGMRIGTKKILGKENAKLFRNTEKFTANAMQSLRKSVEPGTFKYLITRDQLKTMGPAGMPNVAHPNWNRSSAAYVPKNASGAVRKLLSPAGIEAPSVSRKDREAKKWVQAILERHEADEIRHGKKVLNNPRKMLNVKGADFPGTRFFSHSTPKVLVSESANTALAPEGAKNYMRKLRGINTFGATETDTLQQMGNGFKYGKSPIYNKKIGDRLEKESIKSNRANLGQ